MRTYETLGSAPYDEPCAQVGSSDYETKSRAECQRYKLQLENQFLNLPNEMYFAVKSFPHDFGTYREVVLHFDDENDEHLNAMLHVDSNLPSNWSV